MVFVRGESVCELALVVVGFKLVLIFGVKYWFVFEFYFFIVNLYFLWFG